MDKLTFIDKGGSTRSAVEVTCTCGKVFLDRKSQPGKYCSRLCCSNSRIRTVEVNCANCGKLFNKQPGDLKWSKSGLYFCTRLCKDTAQRIGGIEAIQPDHYGSSKIMYRAIYLRAGGVLECARCGYDEFNCGIDVHHLDENRDNNTKENLIALCSNCHRALHNNKWQYGDLK